MSDEDMLDWDESVFQDEHVFEIDFMPEAFLHRETQLESLKYALRPAVRGSRPLNVMVQGPPGTGKTTAIQILFDELRANSRVQPVHINCHVNSTRYSVLSRIYEAVHDYEPPKSGKSFKKLFEEVSKKLLEQDQVLVVGLDDVNYLFYETEASDTLYTLLRAHEEHEGVKIGVIVVSSDLKLDIVESVDGRVNSVFRPEDVYFPQYDVPEIEDILQERVSRGFREGVVDNSVLSYVARRTVEQGGDLRIGIDLLRRSGLKAEMRGKLSVGIEDIDAVFETAKHANLSNRLQDLTEEERGLVEIIAKHEGKGAGEIYEVFHERTDLGYTRYSEIINKLDQLDVIDASYTSVEGRGRSRELTLDYDAEAVLDRL